MASKLIVLTADNHDVIHGVVNFEAPQFLGVSLHPTDSSQLVKATGTRAHLLERQVVASIPLETFVFTPGLETPVKQGYEATARRARLIKVEGTDYIQQSGTGAITSGSAAGTQLGWNNGRLREKQGSDELAGAIRSKETPEDSDNGFALIVELIA